MPNSIRKRMLGAMILLGAFCLLTVRSLTTRADETAIQGQQQDKPVEQTSKNIQVLKGMPSSQLFPVMNLMRTALGVRCDFCHIAENGKYDLDDKPQKQTTRKMIQMMFDINKTNFGGRTVVTCNTCHQGNTRPQPVPAIGQGAFTNTSRDDGAFSPSPMPSVDEVLDKYSQALGGKDAFQKITSRVSKVELLRASVVNSGTPNAYALARGTKWTAELYQKAGDKFLMVISTPQGVVYQGYNGTTGWTKTPAGQREINGQELARIKRQADMFAEFKIKSQFSSLLNDGRDRIKDRDVYVLRGTNLDNKTERLYFDIQSGLLLRRTVYTDTILGRDPEQTDYDDYREMDGVKLPMSIRISYLDDSHLGTSRNYIEVKHNVQIDDAKFNIPVANH